MKGYVGTANIDTNSRLCMSSAVASHVRAFGEDVVPVNYADLELAEMIVLVGSNAAWTQIINCFVSKITFFHFPYSQKVRI